MVVRKLAFAIAVSAAMGVLGGCGILQERSASPIEFNYKVENGSANGIVQTFDMGGNTVVHLRDVEKRTPLFLDDRNMEIPYRIVGQTAILHGVHQAFTVVSERSTSRIVRTVGTDYAQNDRKHVPVTSDPAAAPFARPALRPQVGDGGTSADRDLAAEIKKITREIAELKALLASTDRGKRDTVDGAAPAQLGHNLAASRFDDEPETISVTFRDRSDAFEPSPEVRAVILNRAKRASAISVRGYTDSSVPSATAAQLAKSRALAAKSYLVTNGVQGDKISVGYEPAGKFISDNKTKTGKGLNRRVEISIS